MEEKNQKPMTIEEFDELTEDNTKTYELIDGAVCMTPRPSFIHQNIMRVLIGEFHIYLKGKQCRAFTEVELEIGKNVIIPDISVFCNLDTIDIQRCKQPPVLVVEILSPSNSAMEIEYKRQIYKAHGIIELLIVSPETKSITQYDLINNTIVSYTYPNSFNLISFNDLTINLEEVFEQ